LDMITKLEVGYLIWIILNLISSNWFRMCLIY
jgi:hypothetical protein